MPPGALALLVALGAGPACKVPLSDIDARFLLADTAWFSEEETLFVFYELEAEQGLGAESVLEIRYATDEAVVPWTELSSLPAVHTHVPVDCGSHALCGSRSLHVAQEPRQVELRLRYHRSGELSRQMPALLNIVGPGPAHTHRSLLVYGVLDEGNRAVQWRARHRFPTIRNEDAQRLGLRRRFTIGARRYGEGELDTKGNPYLYGADCPASFSPLGGGTTETEDRAVFDAEDLPDAASSAAAVCADATVHDPTGDFVATAVARKNPEVRPAFPLLRSPIRDATPIRYLLSVCNRTISEEHLAMQRQRLLLGDLPALCIDDWTGRALADDLVILFRADIERVRAEGRDMVLAVALHHDTPALRGVVEEALSRTLATEADRRTPRVAGAFLLDSLRYTVADADLGRRVIWCPAEYPDWGGGEGEGEGEAGGGKDGGGETASLACAVGAENFELSLGPFAISQLPILPSRSLYLDFIDSYSDAQAGRVTSLTFRVPELPPTSDHVPVPPYGVATFFNDEVITADADDAFSYCETDEFPGFVFRLPLAPDFLMPIDALPEWHEFAGGETYELGIVWDFPFLLRLEYESVGAISVSAFSVSVPFGITTEAQEDYGSEVWLSEELSLAETLAHCRRFCDHPTFDSAGVYQVHADFRTTYRATCYAPRYPRRGGTGFPLDP